MQTEINVKKEIKPNVMF